MPKHETLTVHSDNTEDDKIIKEYKIWCAVQGRVINKAVVELLKKHLKIQ